MCELERNYVTVWRSHWITIYPHLVATFVPGDSKSVYVVGLGKWVVKVDVSVLWKRAVKHLAMSLRCSGCNKSLPQYPRMKALSLIEGTIIFFEKAGKMDLYADWVRTMKFKRREFLKQYKVEAKIVNTIPN